VADGETQNAGDRIDTGVSVPSANRSSPARGPRTVAIGIGSSPVGATPPVRGGRSVLRDEGHGRQQGQAVGSGCDDVKRHVLESAFAPLSTADALPVRAVATRLDAVTNAVEDAADQLVYLDHRGP
jgi:hypothetical protein